MEKLHGGNWLWGPKGSPKLREPKGLFYIRAFALLLLKGSFHIISLLTIEYSYIIKGVPRNHNVTTRWSNDYLIGHEYLLEGINTTHILESWWVTFFSNNQSRDWETSLPNGKDHITHHIQTLLSPLFVTTKASKAS